MSASRGGPVGHKRGTVTAPSYGSRGGAGAPLTTSTGTRRIHPATPPRNTSGRSLSSTSPVVNGCELFPGVPDLSRLTSEQKLEIVQRLMKSENISGAGWDQLSSKKEHAGKNLSVEVIECSEIRGNSGDRFVETLEVLVEAKEEEDGEDTALLEKTVDTVEEEYQPEICKLVDDLIIVHDEYKILMERAVDAVVEKNFEEIFPEGRTLRLYNETEEFMGAVEEFSRQSAAENMKLFFPSNSTTPQKKTVHCPVEKQEELLKTVYELSEIMAKLDKHMKDDGWKNMESKVEDKIHLYEKTVDKMERDLKDFEKRKKSIVEGYSLLSTFANPNASGSSGDMLNLEFLKD